MSANYMQERRIKVTVLDFSHKRERGKNILTRPRPVLRLVLGVRKIMQKPTFNGPKFCEIFFGSHNIHSKLTFG